MYKCQGALRWDMAHENNKHRISIMILAGEGPNGPVLEPC